MNTSLSSHQIVSWMVDSSIGEPGSILKKLSSFSAVDCETLDVLSRKHCHEIGSCGRCCWPRYIFCVGLLIGNLYR
jgi:hypothetical protein